MVSKDGKLIILDDIVCNLKYKKFNRLGEKDKKSEEIIELLMPEDVDPTNSSSSVNIDDLKEKLNSKGELSPESFAYNILKQFNRGYLNDRYIYGNDYIPSSIQKYWDGLEVEVDKKSSSDKSSLSKLVSKAMRSSKRIISSFSKTSVIDMMENIKLSLEYLEAEKDTVDLFMKYIDTMKRLDNNPSIYKAAMKITVLENEKRILSDGNFTKYISENQIVKFIRKTEEGLSLDYLKDYDRVIPKEAMDKFDQAENVQAFDNYIILHYEDKSRRKNLDKKHKDQDKRRDPIMFGLIKGSRKLYYICDWVDEYCDLTLSSFLDKIGENINDLLD